MAKAVGSVLDALADEVSAHAEGMYEKLSTDLVTATGSTNDIEGVIHQIDTDADFNAGGGELDVSGESDPSLSLDMLDRAIDLTKGTADIILVNEVVRRRINGLLRSAQRFNDTVEIQAGFRVRSYDGIPMVSVPQWSSDTDILLVRRADAKVLIHQDVTFEELAKVKDSTDFMLKAYVGFALEGRPVHLTGFDLN
jgi:hypothetical protein